MAEKELEKTESSQSTRLQVFEFQVDESAVSRVPSAKSQDTVRSYSSSKIRGLAGLQPVLGRWNMNEREIMNEYLMKRLQGQTENDDEADEKFRTLSVDLLREYLEEMLNSPKKLEEFVTKGLSFQYDRSVVEEELRVLAGEARKAADDEFRKRLGGPKETRNKEGTGAGTRTGPTDLSTPTGIESGLQGSQKDIFVVGVQLVKLKDAPQDQSAPRQSIQTSGASPASSQKQSGRVQKEERKDEGTWSPASSEIQVHEEDLRGSPGSTAPSDWIDGGPRTADTSSGGKDRKPEQEKQKGTSTPVDLLGQESKQTKGHDTANKSRQSSENVEQSKGHKVTTVKHSEGQKVNSGRHSEGQKVTSARHSEGQKVTSGKHSAGQKVTTVTQSGGQKVTSVKQSEGQTGTSETAADIEPNVGDLRGAKKKPRSKKGRRSTSGQIQDSVDSDGVPVKSHQIQTSLDGKLAEGLPESQPAGGEEKAVEPSSDPPPTAGKEESAVRKKGAQPRPLKTKSPRKHPVKGAGLSTVEPDSEPIPEPDPETTEMDQLEHPDREDGLLESLDHAAELTHEAHDQSETMYGFPPKGPARPPSSHPPDQQHLPPPQLPLHLVRQTLRDNIFFGFYFTRAFVFSYFRTKPSHYDLSLSVPLLKADVLDATQRRLLRELIEDPYRYRCLRDVRAVERMQALAKTAGRKSMATSPISRHLQRLPNLLGSA